MDSPNTTICRFCLFDGKDESRPIFNLFSSFEFLSVLKHVQNLLKIQLSPKDSIPPMACRLCVEKIKYASDFLETCESAKKELKLIFGGPSFTCVKAEKASSTTTLKRFPNDSETSETSVESGKKLKASKPKKNIVVRSGKKIQNSLERIKRPKTAPSNERSNFNYKKCKKMLKNTSALKLIKCSKCEKEFPSKLKLISHEQSHKVPCQICYKLVYPKRLETHLIKHANKFQKKLESVSKQKIKVSCEICLKSFRSAHLLNSHKSKVHKNVQKSEKFKIKIKGTFKKNKQIICEICNQAFLSRRELKSHIILHKGDEILELKEICDATNQNFDQNTNGSSVRDSNLTNL